MNAKLQNTSRGQNVSKKQNISKRPLLIAIDEREVRYHLASGLSSDDPDHLD